MASCAVVLEALTSVMDSRKSPRMTLVAFELHLLVKFGSEKGVSVDTLEGFSSRNDSATGMRRCAGLSSGAGGGWEFLSRGNGKRSL